MTEPVLLAPRLAYVERVIRIPDVELFDLSKDGKTALVLSNQSGSYQLEAVPVAGGQLRPVSHGRERVASARISSDSEIVCFSRDFGGKEEHQLFTVPLVDGEEEQQLTQLPPTRIANFNWSNGGDRLVFAGATKEANGVWLVDSSSGQHREIYRNRHWVFSPEWSKDDSRICVSAKTTEVPTALELLFLDPEGESEPVVYTPKDGSENTNGGWHPSEPWILFKTDCRGRYELAVYKTGSGELSYLRGGGLGLGFDFPVLGWMPNGNSVYYLAAKEGRTRLYVEGPDGSEPPKEVPVPEGYHAGFFGASVKVAESGDYFVFSWSSLSSPPTLSRHDTKTGRATTLREHFTDLPLGKADHVVYNSFDGRPIHGWFLKPAQLEGRRPCVLWIHGGPAWEVADAWNPAIQSFLVAGYTLFAPNIRGSTGYGVEFQNLNIYDCGGADLKDVEEAAKYLRTRPEVDPSKIALVGASYGGFMTFLGTTKLPDYWAAGAAIVGITDWKEMYELSDALFKSFIERYFGKPEEKPQLYHDRSAIHFAESLKAPLLIWHRGNDSRCPLAPVEKFATRLRELGKDYEMQVVWDEGHGFQKTENLARQYKAVVEFLDRKLGPSN
jgi:dipeptidyl aminopeptidase/acylaminoacyl peptidase